jgi:hypothetical protein
VVVLDLFVYGADDEVGGNVRRVNFRLPGGTEENCKASLSLVSVQRGISENNTAAFNGSV